MLSKSALKERTKDSELGWAPLMAVRLMAVQVVAAELFEAFDTDFNEFLDRYYDYNIE